MVHWLLNPDVSHIVLDPFNALAVSSDSVIAVVVSLPPDLVDGVVLPLNFAKDFIVPLSERKGNFGGLSG